MNYRIISADDHIDLQWLPKDLWQKRVPAQWRERAPKVVEENFKDVTPAARRRILCDNARALYGL